MISDKTIQEVKDRADLVTVIKKYAPDLKKRGANYTGCCPFHDEKTGSFTVNEVKGIYKCFGCGAGGNNAINFVMDKLNFDFPSAIKYLANWFSVDVQETITDEETAEVKETRGEYLKICAWATRKFQKSMLELKEKASYEAAEINPVIDQLINVRKFTNDSLVDFKIGYAPHDFRFLTGILLEQGKYKLAADIGLVTTKDNKNFDVYIDRIIFPIQNERGEVIGFGGRRMGDNKEYAKFLNSSDSLIYKKEHVLYGIYQAAAAIRKLQFANLVEGYADVVSFHQTGAPNTVATCGTALTAGHCRVLKRHTNHIVVIGDGDAAGQKANLKNIDLLLSFGFKVDVCLLPEEHDPDSFARTFDYREEAA